MNPKALTNTQKHAHARRLYRTGDWSKLQLCDHLGVTSETMRGFLRGLPNRSSASKGNVFTEQQGDAFLKLVRAGMSMRQIALQSGTGCAPSTVTLAIKRARKREESSRA